MNGTWGCPVMCFSSQNFRDSSCTSPKRQGTGVCSPTYARQRIGTERTELGPTHVYTFGGWFIFLNCPMSRADNKKAYPVSSSALCGNIYIYIGEYIITQIYSQIKWNSSPVVTVGLRVKLTCTVNAS